MELLGAALTSSVNLCWVIAQLIALSIDSWRPKGRTKVIRQGLNLLSTVLYVVALLLLGQLGFEQSWELFWTVVAILLGWTVAFGSLRYLRHRREASRRNRLERKNSNVHPR